MALQAVETYLLPCLTLPGLLLLLPLRLCYQSNPRKRLVDRAQGVFLISKDEIGEAEQPPGCVQGAEDLIVGFVPRHESTSIHPRHYLDRLVFAPNFRHFALKFSTIPGSPA